MNSIDKNLEHAMTTARPTHGLRRHLPALVTIVALAAICAWLMARSHGLNPTVFADEWYYSKMARLQPLAEAIVPSYLYLWLFGASKACGDGYMECVRGANALLFVAAAPFLYLIARSVTGRATAFVIALLATFAPLNLYTAYFMPEATYYFGFCVLSWVALTRRDWHWALHALASGLVLGAMSLLKVHAVFLIPALCLYLLYAAWLQGGAWFGRGLAAMAIGAAGTLAVKFGLGYVLAGDAGLSLFGPFYDGARNAAGNQSPWRLVAPGIVNGRGHLMLLAVAFGLPLAMLAQALLRPTPRVDAGQADRLRAWTLLMLGAAGGMTVLYTATLDVPGTREILRLHLRYYSFVFPLLWVVAASAFDAKPRRQALLRWVVALLLSVVIAIAFVKLPTYAIGGADGPEALAAALDDTPGRIVACLGIAALLLWAAGRGGAAGLFLFVLAPVFVANGLTANHKFLQLHATDQESDMAGKAAHRIVPPAERGSVTVAGYDLGQLMRTQFHIDSKDSAIMELAPNAPIEPYQIPIRNQWLVVFGHHPLPPGIVPVEANAHYAIVHLNNKVRVLGHARLSEAPGQGLLERVEGLSAIEAFGRWSDSKQVVLHLNTTLPKRLNIVMKAWAFGDNTEKPFIVRVGGSEASFRVSGAPQEVGVRMDTDGAQNSIVIEVPHPVSPQDYGSPGDPRKLGIALAEIEISTPED